MESSHLLTAGAIIGIGLFMMKSVWCFCCGLAVAGIYLLRQWSQGKRCKYLTRLDGKIVIITGGNSGIGKATALEMSRRGAKVIIGSRNLQKSRQVADEIHKETGKEVLVFELDLANFASVRTFVGQVSEVTDEVHVLVNNAGIAFIEKEMTVDGNEKQMQVNHLGHFLLTGLLMPALMKAKPARVINLSSLAHNWVDSVDPKDLNFDKEEYGKVKAYAKSKLANILFTREFSQRYREKEIYAFAVHPGTVSTEISAQLENYFPAWFNASVGEFIKTIFLKTAENGAQTTLHCALFPEPELLCGEYFAECRKHSTSKAAQDARLAKVLWKKSARIVSHVFEPRGDASSDSSDSDDAADQIRASGMTIPENAPIMQILNTIESLSDNPEAAQQANRELIKQKGFEIEENKNINDASSSSESEEDKKYEKFDPKEVFKRQEHASQYACHASIGAASSIKKNIETFDVGQLKPAQVNEKIILPSQEDIEDEKALKEKNHEKFDPKEPISSDSEVEKEPVMMEVKEAVIETKAEEIKETPLIQELNEAEIKQQKEIENKIEESSSSSESEGEEIKEIEQVEMEALIEPIETEIENKTEDSSEVEEIKQVEPVHETDKTETDRAVISVPSCVSKDDSSSSDDDSVQIVGEVKKDEILTLESSISEDEKDEHLSKIESFDKSNLNNVEPVIKSTIPDIEAVTQEKEIIEQETEQNKESFTKVTQELLQHKVEDLIHTQVKESNTLPDKYDFQIEKQKENLGQDLLNFDASSLKPVSTFESSSIEVFKRQDSIKKNIETFDVGQLKPAQVDEKIILPSQEDIEDEKAFIEKEISTHKETFTREVVEELEAFDSKILKHVEHDSSSDDEKEALKENYLQEKTHQKLLEEVSSFEETKLAHVNTLEPMTGIELAKTEMSRNTTLESVTSFDKTQLKSTVTEEKIILPDCKTLELEKENEGRDKVLNEISSFETSTLKATETQEKILLPTGDEITRERVHRELLTDIESYDTSNLAATEIDEKIVLPDSETIQQEKLERSNSSSSSDSSQPTTSSSGASSWEKVETNDDA